jgi:hypothetical protein
LKTKSRLQLRQEKLSNWKEGLKADAAKKELAIIHSKKKCYKIESNAERKEKKRERKVGPEKHQAFIRRALGFCMRRERIRKKRNERKLCEQLSHVAAFDTLLAFVNATAGFSACRVEWGIWN